MQANVYTIALLPAQDGKVNALIERLKSLAAATWQERGCIEYGFYQDAADPNLVISYERWVDQQAEDLHWRTPHLTEAIEAMKELLSSEPQVFKTHKII